jgi:superfamily II DNA or RNA helicase
MALRMDPVRLLIGDDVGIGKTVEAGLVAKELLAQGDVRTAAVLCSPALAEQWQRELRDKFALDAELVLTSTVRRLERDLLMHESLFDRHPLTVISTDFIKSSTRRHEFLNHAPDLVIVDEAHTAVTDGTGTGGRHQRHELLAELAADPARHLVLVTATPHSGKEAGFRNLLALLDPELEHVDLDARSDRERLARHFVQRRRADIRRYLDEDTQFPSDRETRDVPYRLTDPYRDFVDAVLAYARGRITGAQGRTTRQRVQWWGVLALLRAVASSPRAAAATLRTRAAVAAAGDPDEADALGRAAVLDTADDEALEGLDVTPGAITDPGPDHDRAGPDGEGTARAAASGDRADSGSAPGGSEQRRLRALAQQADALAGARHDAKLQALTGQVTALLADGFDPIVFCRFIDTAEYVAEHLAGALGAGVEVAAVTGTLPPAEREARIAALTATDARHVLVATDCLSEGVNLQDAFAAVVHYDLAWNPTRHEQREGRVDRFGQPKPRVRAVTIYGTDNGVDGIVLDVLIRKHREISAATGVSVPVPDGSDSVVEALLEGLVVKGKDTDQLSLDIGFTTARDQLDLAWRSAAEQERQSRTKYAQGTIHPEDVLPEVEAVRAALGSLGEIEAFTEEALRALGASVVPTGDGFRAVTATLPVGVRDTLPPGHAEPLPFHRSPPAPRRHAALVRTDPAVEALARHVLDTALDPRVSADARPAHRAGVIRTSQVRTRTTVLLVRFRHHLTVPGRRGLRPVVAEDARLLAFRGRPDDAEWLTEADAAALARATPDANVPADQAGAQVQRVLDRLDAVRMDLEARADECAEELLSAHRRVRAEIGAARRGLSVTAQKPVDVLGVYLYLPVAAGAADG